MTGSFMKLPPHKPGYCWSNIAPLGSDPEWVEIVSPLDDTNAGKLFGYDTDVFMRKQYK
jgi:hypothetical protein